MPIKTPIVALFAVCLIVSCKKNNGTGSNGNPNKLKQYIEQYQFLTTNTSDTFQVSYDNQNRLTGLSSPLVRLAYTYTSATSFTLDLFQYGQLAIHEVGYVNSASYIDSSFQYNNTNDSTTQKFIYSGSLLTRQKTYSYSHLASIVSAQDDYTYDNNGNLTKDVNSDGIGDVNYITAFTYTDHPLNVTINPTYYPPQSKNLPATQKVTDSGGNSYANITYAYVFDSAGRLTKETETADDGEIFIKIYVYN